MRAGVGGDAVNRVDLVSMVLSAAACFWLPGSAEVICPSCFGRATLKPIRFWPITDEHHGQMCGLDQSLRYCDWCTKEIVTQQRRAS